MLVTKKSAFSGVTRTLDIPITEEQLKNWENGKRAIQDVMPNLNSSQREFLMTGIIDEEWDKIFP